MNWILENKEWIFSGIGVSILLFILNYFISQRIAQAAITKLNKHSNSNSPSPENKKNETEIVLENNAIRIPAMGQMFLYFLRHKYGTPLRVTYLVKEGDFVKKGDPIGRAGVTFLSPFDGKILVIGLLGYTFWNKSDWMQGHDPVNKIQEQSRNLIIIQPVKGSDAKKSIQFSYQHVLEEIQLEFQKRKTSKKYSERFENWELHMREELNWLKEYESSKFKIVPMKKLSRTIRN